MLEMSGLFYFAVLVQSWIFVTLSKSKRFKTFEIQAQKKSKKWKIYGFSTTKITQLFPTDSVQMRS